MRLRSPAEVTFWLALLAIGCGKTAADETDASTASSTTATNASAGGTSNRTTGASTGATSGMTTASIAQTTTSSARGSTSSATTTSSTGDSTGSTVCSDGLCLKPLGGACQFSDDCTSDTCSFDGGVGVCVCQPLTVSESPPTCRSSADCCAGGLCPRGEAGVSTCTGPVGFDCTWDYNCSSLNCGTVAGHSQCVCNAGAGGRCGLDSDCCSGTCGDAGTCH